MGGMSDEDGFKKFVADKLVELDNRISDLQRTLDSIKITVEVTQNQLRQR
ncbi:hypothetical protein MAUB1S_01798 [Mycolicibacterium aubagnense]